MKLNNKASKNYLEQENLNDYQIKLYFKNGYATVHNMDQSQEDLISRLKWETIQNKFLKELTKPLNVWLILLSVLYLSLRCFDGAIIFMIQLLLNFVIQSIRLFFQIKTVLKQIDEHNKHPIYQIIWDPKCHISQVTRKDLKIGDIIFLKRHQDVPVNILILNSQEEKFMIKTWEKDSISNLTEKKSLLLTTSNLESNEASKQNFIYFKRILTGKIEFDPLDNANKQFHGYIKLQKDPKGEYITYDNIIPQTSFIMNTDWVIGIYISTDNNEIAQIWKCVFERNFSYDLDEYFKRFIWIYILLWVIELLITFVQILMFNREQLSLIQITQRILKNIALVQPALIIFVTELLFLQWETQFRDSPDTKFNNAEELLNFQNVDLCIYDKTGTLTNANIILGGSIVLGQFFPLDNESTINQQNQPFHKVQLRKLSLLNEVQEENEISFHQSNRPLSHQRLSKGNVMLDEFFGLNAISRKYISLKSSQNLKNNQSVEDESSIVSSEPQAKQILKFNEYPMIKKKKSLSFSPQTDSVQKEDDIKSQFDEIYPPSPSSGSMRPILKSDRTIFEQKRQNLFPQPILEESKEIQVLDTFNNLPQQFKESSSINQKENLQNSEYVKLSKKSSIQMVREGNQQLAQFMKALILCQDIKTKVACRGNLKTNNKKYNVYTKIKSKGSLYESSNIETEKITQEDLFNETAEEYQDQIIKYAKLHGFQFICAGELNKQLCYEIDALGQCQRYKVIKKTYIDDTFSVIFEDIPYSNQQSRVSYHYIKSESPSLLNQCIISQAKKVAIEKQIASLQMSGYRFIFYAGQKMDERHQRQNSDLSIIYTTESDPILNFENGLIFYGVCCLKEQYNYGAQQIARQIKNLQVNQWVLSADRVNQTLGTCYSVSILNHEQTLLRVDQMDEEDLKLQIKSHLLFLRKQLLKEDEFDQETNNGQVKKKLTLDEKLKELKLSGSEPLMNISLIVNGTCINTLMNDNYLKAHFLFIAFCVKTVVVYNCTPKDKEDICREVSQINPNLLIISDSIDDTGMTQYSKASVRYLNLKSKVDISHSNLMVTNLQHVKQFILYHSKTLSFQIRSQTLFIVKCSIVVMLLQMTLFQSLNNIDISQGLTYKFAILLLILIPVCGICKADDRSTEEQLEILIPQALPQFFRQLQRKIQWAQEILIEIILTCILSCAMIPVLYVNFMISRTDTNPQVVSFLIHKDLIFIIQSSVILSLSLSHLNFLGINLIKQISILSSFLVIMILALAIDCSFRDLILSKVFSLNYLLGIKSIVIFMFLGDLMIKDLRARIFKNPNIQSFLKFCKQNFNPENKENFILQRIIQYPVQVYVKISQDFFNGMKKVFNWVTIDPFIRNCIKNHKCIFIVFETQMESSLLQNQNSCTLVFKDDYLENDFRRRRLLKYFHNRRNLMTSVLFGFMIHQSIKISYNIAQILICTLQIILILIRIITEIIKQKKNPDQNIYLYEDFCINQAKIDLYFLLPVQLIVFFIYNVTQNDTLDIIIIYLIIMWDVFPPPLCYPSIFILIQQLIFMAINISNNSDFSKTNQQELLFYVAEIINISFMAFVAIFTHRQHELTQRNTFTQDQQLLVHQEQTNHILKLLLPPFIYEKIEMNQTQIEENQGQVAIIFIDICHFDKILTSKQRQVVSFLDKIFRVFDKVCVQHGVQKIETVGKTYMACSGLKFLELLNSKDGINDHQESETEVALLISLQFLKLCRKFNFTYNGQVERLQIKIGIHYGTVIAGVIGYHKPQFSLIGDTVNTASRMCSTSKEGRITVSQDAYDRIDTNRFHFVSRNVYAKGKGDLIVYEYFERSFGLRRRKSLPNFLDGLPQYRLILEQGMYYSSYSRSTHSNVRRPRDILNRSKNHTIQNKQGSFHEFMLKSRSPIRSVLLDQNQRKKTAMESNTHISVKEFRNRIQSMRVIGIQKCIIQEEQEEVQLQNIDWYPEKRMIQAHIENTTIELTPQITIQAQKQYLNFNSITLNYEKSNPPDRIKEFKQYLCKNNQSKKVLYLSISVIYYILMIHVRITIDANSFISYVIQMGFVLFMALGALVIIIQKRLQNEYLYTVAFYGIFTTLIFLIAVVILQDPESISQAAIQAFFINLFAVNNQAIEFKHAFVCLIVQQICWLSILINQEDQETYPFILMSYFLLIIISYSNFKETLKGFNASILKSQQKQQKDTLLTNLLPVHILTRFYQNIKLKLELSDELSEATILFADIAGFTAYSQSVSPEKVVEMLRNLMTAFDKECLQKSVYKVYTIGDCYVVLGVNNMENRNPGQEAKNVIEMGLQMVEIIKKVRNKIHYQDLNMRIGIHTGAFYGGVIGTDIVRYDIFGIDAVIANKMESHGKPGQVMVSETTKQLINNYFPNEYNFTFHKDVEIPVAKKNVNGYFVEKNSLNDSLPVEIVNEIQNG